MYQLVAVDSMVFLLTALRTEAVEDEFAFCHTVLAHTGPLLHSLRWAFAQQPSGYTAPELVSMYAA
jgi:hypothetical protein